MKLITWAQSQITKALKSRLNILLLFLLYLISCDTRHGRQVSDTIADSKERGIFICEYKPLTNPLVVNDTIKIDIEEAWLESQWMYSSKNGMYISAHDQLCINVKPEKHLEDLDLGWCIGIDGSLYMRKSSKTSLISDFKTLPPDTINYKVQKGSELSDNYKKTIIGQFIVIKK
jgi:hypothetical protein